MVHPGKTNTEKVKGPDSRERTAVDAGWKVKVTGKSEHQSPRRQQHETGGKEGGEVGESRAEGGRERGKEGRGIKTTAVVRTAPRVLAVGSGPWALPFLVHCWSILP